MSQPVVSIIVPVYNAEKGIRRCVDSILGQEFTDFELLLVDDGSTDGSPAILDAYAAADPRVSVIQKPNSGVSATRNMALDRARGEYIQFLDADDWITEDATKLLVRAARENDADMVIADFYRVVGDDVARKGQIGGDATSLSRQEYADLMMKDPADFYYGVIWNKLYRRSIIEAHGVRMDETLNWCEDFIFNLEYVLHVSTVAVLRSPIYYYVKTEGSLVSHTDLADVVRMKRTVLGYYRDFYRTVLDEDEYKRRRTDIYRYLISFATDDAAIGGMPGTTKLGRERVPAFVPAGARPNPFLGVYWAQRVLDRYLDRVAEQNDLTLKQTRIMAYLRYCPGVVDIAALSDFLDQTRATTMVDLQRLAVSGLIDLDWRDGGFAATFSVPRGEQVAAGIDHAAADFVALVVPAVNQAAGQGTAAVLDAGFDALAQALNKSSTMQLAKEAADAKAAKADAKASAAAEKSAQKATKKAAKKAARESAHKSLKDVAQEAIEEAMEETAGAMDTSAADSLAADSESQQAAQAAHAAGEANEQ